jgi:hypothetical protein
MILSERRTDQGLLVTVCDGDVVGDTFENGDVSLTVEEAFYAPDDSEEADPDAVVASLGKASVANLVGTETVELAIEEGFVDPDSVLEIDGTLHAQLLRMG